MKRASPLLLLSLLVLALAPTARIHAAPPRGGSAVHAAVPPELTVLIGLGQLEVSQGAQLSYAPKYLDITVGDTVAWREIDQLEPHTVSFGPMAMLKDLSRKDQNIPIPQKAGPPMLQLNPKVAFPTPGTTYDGTGFASSGILALGKTWTLTFTTPGTYQYICLIHGVAMNGYVVAGLVNYRRECGLGRRRRRALPGWAAR